MYVYKMHIFVYNSYIGIYYGPDMQVSQLARGLVWRRVWSERIQLFLVCRLVRVASTLSPGCLKPLGSSHEPAGT